MSDEAANYQAEIRSKLHDLRASLDNRFVRWNDWERQFILSLVVKLEYDVIDISPKQYRRVWDLWEKSLL